MIRKVLILALLCVGLSTLAQTRFRQMVQIASPSREARDAVDQHVEAEELIEFLLVKQKDTHCVVLSKGGMFVSGETLVCLFKDLYSGDQILYAASLSPYVIIMRDGEAIRYSSESRYAEVFLPAPAPGFYEVFFTDSTYANGKPENPESVTFTILSR